MDKEFCSHIGIVFSYLMLMVVTGHLIGEKTLWLILSFWLVSCFMFTISFWALSSGTSQESNKAEKMHKSMQTTIDMVHAVGYIEDNISNVNTDREVEKMEEAVQELEEKIGFGRK